MTKNIYMCVLSALFVFLTVLAPNRVLADATPTKINDYTQLSCVATAVYHEARGEGVLGMAAVAKVIMNRVEHGFADSPCEVVYQTSTTKSTKVCQFSWVCTKKEVVKKENEQYRHAHRVAYAVLVKGEFRDVVPDNAVFFRSKHIAAMNRKPVAQIGNHVFYAQRRVKK